MKAMEADDEALAKTLEKFKIGTLFSNTTYASEDEIMQYACQMPEYITEFLSWTAGVTPIVCVWIVFLMWKNLRHLKCCSKQPMKVVVVEDDGEIELTEPPKNTMSTPPRPMPRNLSVPRDLSNMDQVYLQKPKQHGGIRKRKKKKEGPGVLEKLTSLSPSLKNRIMGNTDDLGV